jgi:hypothetical protein
MATYNVSGPAAIGRAATSNTLLGNFTLTDATNTFNFNAAGAGTNSVSNFYLTTAGDLLTYTGGALARLPIGSNGQGLTVSGGALTWQTVPIFSNASFSANKNGTQAISTSTQTVITTWTEIFDNGNIFNNATGVMTAATTGLYFAYGAIEWATGNNVGLRDVRLLVNGTQVDHMTVQPSADTTIATCLRFGKILSLTATDTVSVAVFQDSGGSINVASGNGTNFGIVRVF